MPAGTKKPPETPETTQAKTPVRQLAVFLHNRVGALLGLVKLLNDHQIEVLGLSVQDSVELTLVRLVVTDPEDAEKMFAEQGLSCASRVIVVVELRQGVHDLSHALSALLAAEINIHHSYPLMTRPTGKPLLAFYLDDAEVGAEALGKSGLRVLTQGELSR
jgi:hypothetical protein